MASLAESNPHIADPENRRRLIVRNAVDSSAFEGARGLKVLEDGQDSSVGAIADKKKSRNGANSSR